MTDYANFPAAIRCGTANAGREAGTRFSYSRKAMVPWNT